MMRLMIRWPWSAALSEAAERRQKARQFWTWLNEQQRALASGEEIEPPWIQMPGCGPDHGTFRQGGHEMWMEHVWKPFWISKGPEERGAYLDKWDAPDEWREILNKYY